MRGVGVYLKERFPLPLVLLLAAGYSLFLVGISAPVDNTIMTASLTALAFTAFLLRQRVTDEFKDLTHDTKNYPTRPLQRGLVSKQQLITLGMLSLGIEFLAVFAVGGLYSLLWYLPVFIFTLLMAFEFFASNWLEKHFTLYFLLHQLVFIGFIIWFFGATNTPVSPAALASAVAFLLTMCSVEIVRKFEIRRDAKKKVVLDTYPAVWGRALSIVILAACVIGSGALLVYASGNVYPLVISVASLSVIAWQHKSDTYIRVAGAGAFIAQSIGVFIS